jgi:class 3 adenylate cyclase/tetratricopeptide (TPR) repeat protein
VPPTTAPLSIDRTAPRSYTPKHLADKILGSRGALEGERKQVTVLFVDVSGFTSLSERLDPEDVHRMMTRAFELMLAEVHRYEGTVNQFLGDGIMALFGAPIAHEDHAVRALHAALGIRTAMGGYAEELQRRRGIGFQVRQGINTGPVVVGSIGTDLRMDYTAVGDTTNVAARLVQTAERGRILVSEATHRLTAGYFHTRPLGDLQVKGKAERIQGFELIAARSPRTRLDVSAERGLTPYVGRERELETLRQCFERAKAGHGHMVFVVGDAGIGKSRLLHEFRGRLGDEATWVEGRCISFGQSMPFHPIIDMVKRTFRIEEADPASVIANKLERGVILLGEDLRPILPYLYHLLSIDPGEAVATMDPQQRRGEVFAALQRLLVRASEVRPQVLVHEDLHWIDTASEESLLFTADSIPTSRVLHILTYRPGYKQPFGERSFHTRIALPTLSSEDSVQMTRAVLGAATIPGELEALIVRKAEGNPFFVEEVVKSLHEIGAVRRDGDRYTLTARLDEIVIPDTIQDVIMARIDRLADAPKKTLQLASVIGREFTRRLLERIADIRGRTEDFLRELKALELIYEKALFPELAYMFKHALTHDVAYSSMLVQRRKELHRVIALAIVELYADRLAEQYEVLGYHFSKAEDWTRALEYLLKAAEKATKAFANREAITLYEQAVGATRQIGDTVSIETLMAIHEAKANLCFVLSDFESSCAEWQRVLGFARQSGDRQKEAAALAGMAWALVWAHKFDRAVIESRQALALAEPIDAQPVIAATHLTTGLVYFVTGRLSESRHDEDRALAISRSVADHGTESIALMLLGQLRRFEGDFAEAIRLESFGLRLAREHKLVVPLIFNLFVLGAAQGDAGAYGDALTTLQEGLAFTEKVGDEILHQRILNTSAWLHLELGDTDRAIELNTRCLEGARKRGDPETTANAEINLAEDFIVKGDLTMAGVILDGVHRMVDDPAVSEWMKWRYSTHLFAALGELWLARGDWDRARQFGDRCLEVATRTNSRKYRARGWRLQGEQATARRQWDDAEAALRMALSTAQEIGSPAQLWKTHAAFTRFYADQGKSDESERARRATRHVLESIRERLQNPGLRQSVAGLIRQAIP